MRQRGFTLLELVAAMAIFALLSVMAYGGLNALIQTNRSLETNFEQLRRWQMTVHRLRMDLAQVRPRPVRDQFGDVLPSLYQPEEERLEFTRGGRRNPLLLPRSNLERVAYVLDSDGRLHRESWFNLDRAQSDEAQSQLVLEGIEDLQWRFLDNEDEWQESWPPASSLITDPAAIELPRAIELKLESRRLGLLRFLFPVQADL